MTDTTRKAFYDALLVEVKQVTSITGTDGGSVEKIYVARRPIVDPSFDIAVQIVPGLSRNVGGPNSPLLCEESFEIVFWQRSTSDWGVRDDAIFLDADFSILDRFVTMLHSTSLSIIWNTLAGEEAVASIQYVSSGPIEDLGDSSGTLAFMRSSWTALWTASGVPTAPHV